MVVTGGSRGIGAMIAEGFVTGGATVFISARKAAACDATAAALSADGDCISVPADLTTDEGRRRVVDAVREHSEKLDILVNNAGATWGAPVDDYPIEAFEKVLTTNVTSVFALTQSFLPSLRAAADDEDPARIINIGSLAGLRVIPDHNFAYTASKAAVHMLTQHLAATLAPDRITVNAIAPGPFPTKMMAHILGDPDVSAEFIRHVPLGRVGRPDDIAGLCEFLAGPRASWITGAVIPLGGGLAF